MIPGFIISLITFPGVIVHELAHQLFCRLFRVAVLDVCYFQFGNPAGFVVHETPSKHAHHILIGIGPFFVNSILGALIAFPAMIPLLIGQPSAFDIFLLWLGVSIAMHAFPSTGDAQSIWQAVWSPGTSWLTRIVATPLVVLIYLGALGSFFWLDVLYGVGVAFALPHLLVQWLA
jgi:hypothetical protein